MKCSEHFGVIFETLCILVVWSVRHMGFLDCPKVLQRAFSFGRFQMGWNRCFYQSAIVVGGGFKNDVKNPFVHGTSFEDEMWIFTWVICVRDKKTARSSKWSGMHLAHFKTNDTNQSQFKPTNFLFYCVPLNPSVKSMCSRVFLILSSYNVTSHNLPPPPSSATANKRFAQGASLSNWLPIRPSNFWPKTASQPSHCTQPIKNRNITSQVAPFWRKLCGRTCSPWWSSHTYCRAAGPRNTPESWQVLGHPSWQVDNSYNFTLWGLGFPKMGVPQKWIVYNGQSEVPYNGQSEVPYFRKPPYLSIRTYECMALWDNRRP